MPDETPYNLIDERWIPVRRRSGAVEMVAPAEIADRVDPPLAIQSPRPDFDGALLEFLIGLMQTAAAPRTESLWRQRFEKPPEVAALKSDFDTVREAFVLNGNGPRFMQDLTVAEDPEAKELPIGALLIDRVGESELDQSPTLFTKPGGFEAFGYPAAAAALMAMQSYAPSGGRGQLTSLRAGGPLTTVILGEDLWRTVCLNVIPQVQFERLIPGEATLTERRFPWMVPTRTSETKGGRATHPEEVHPTQHYWGLPRRYRLDIRPGDIGTCAVSGQVGVAVVRALKSRPSGTSYEGDFRHPLTPYKQIESGQPWAAKRGNPDGLPYRDWPQLATQGAEREPAKVVFYALSERRELLEQRRMAAFGYATENMKPLRWCQATTPLIASTFERSEQFFGEVERLVLASEEVRRTLVYQVKAAWSDRPKDVPGDAPGRVNPAFWSRTESAFFQSVSALCAVADRAAGDVIREAWLVELHRAALALFDSFAATTVDLATADLGRVVLARRDLSNFTSPASVKLRKALGLPVVEPAQSGKPKRGRSKKTSDKESNS